ncbi:hypothetical protein [Cupriavidus sp. D384]|uniref:hypothetical protein n=1 Tax=Cupriavidus sp. D384 TaxID=1538095 RepID=UPI00083495CE|nr:hypothetical protein [Cupriavidus sp. D384]
MNVSPQEYCTFIGGVCATLADWKDWTAIAGTVATIIIGVIGLGKVLLEISRLQAQKQKEIDERDRAALLKRTEFFLSQHRRLFDTPDLFEVLCLIDGVDSHKLAENNMWDKKRKFLTFFEEMALLANNKMLDEHVADYMFSYYAKTAWESDSFREGIDPSAEHWGLLFDYLKQAESRRNSSTCPAPRNLKL